MMPNIIVAPKADGLLTISDPGRDPVDEERRTFQCIHCGAHFEVRRIGGKFPVPYCVTHDGPYCPKPECDPDSPHPHMHVDQRLLLDKPGIRVPVPIDVAALKSAKKTYPKVT